MINDRNSSAIVTLKSSGLDTPKKLDGCGTGEYTLPRHRVPYHSRSEGSNALDEVASNIRQALWTGAATPRTPRASRAASCSG
jgi:hypothetical protein